MDFGNDYDPGMRSPYVGCVLLHVMMVHDASAQRPPKAPAPSPAAPPPPAAVEAPKTPPLKSPGPEITVSVKDVVAAALAYNPDLVRSGVDAKIAAIEVKRQRGTFDVVLSLNGSHRSEGTYLGSGTDPTVTATTSAVDLGLAGRTTWGGQYTLAVRGGRTAGFSLLPTLLPSFDTLVGARYQQSLLRGGGFTANQGLIDRAQLNAKSASEGQRAASLTLALDVIASYWTLVLRREEVKIREQSVAMAVSLRDLVDKRIRGGQAPRGEIVQADATVAERELQVRQAQLTAVDAERELLTLTFINRAGTFRWNNTLVPGETPRTTPVDANLDDELKLALASRPEMKRFARDLELATLNRDIAANERRPQLDLYAEAGVAGFAGTSTVAAGDPGAPPQALVGGLGTSLGNLGKAPYWEVGVLFSVPIGNRTRGASAEQAELRIEQIKAQDVSTLIAIDVRAALQALDIAKSRLVGAQARVKLAEENVDVYRKRYEGGTSTIFDTLRVQDELARARAELVLAAAEQEVAHARLLAARGTLLETFGAAPTKP